VKYNETYFRHIIKILEENMKMKYEDFAAMENARGYWTFIHKDGRVCRADNAELANFESLEYPRITYKPRYQESLRCPKKSQS